MLRIMPFTAVSFLSFLYAVGFIYDTGYLSEFGYDSIQIPAPPQEYLVLGSVFLLNGVVKKFVVVFFGFGVIAAGYKPIARAVNRHELSNYIDFESVPYILTATIIPILILMVGPILLSGKTDAIIIKKGVSTQEIVLLKDSKPYTCGGVILRNRNNMVLFYDKEMEQAILTPHSHLIKSTIVDSSLRD